MARLKPLRESLAAIAARLGRARALFVATDFDGTLAPIARHPAAAAPAPGVRSALRRIARLPRAGVAVLSGRALDDLARRVRLAGVFLSGTNGLETMDARGRRALHVPRGRRLSAALKGALADWCGRFRGAWLEDKRLSVALHYRAVPARRQAAFRAGARRRLRSWAGRVKLVPGKKVLEVMPAVGADKAVALARALPGRRGPVVVYLGDDENDEPAHALVRRRGGIAVAVGRSRSRAEYALRSPREVTRFLGWLARLWKERVSRNRADRGAARARTRRAPVRRAPRRRAGRPARAGPGGSRSRRSGWS
jgi:trehalose-phosphatase